MYMCIYLFFVKIFPYILYFGGQYSSVALLQTAVSETQMAGPTVSCYPDTEVASSFLNIFAIFSFCFHSKQKGTPVDCCSTSKELNQRETRNMYISIFLQEHHRNKKAFVSHPLFSINTMSNRGIAYVFFFFRSFFNFSRVV